MVDRDARNRLAEALRHLVTGRMTNYEFDEAIQIETDDAAFYPIRKQAWFLYSDLREHRLVGSDALSKSNKRMVARFILFLHSDLEYEWPRYPFDGVLGAIARGLSYLLSFGRIPRQVDKNWEAAGDSDVWPFISRKDYEEALTKPRYLRGRAA
jgi:hypothetical protein